MVKPAADQGGVQEGSSIEIGQVVLRKNSYDLADMLAQVTPDQPPSRMGYRPCSR